MKKEHEVSKKLRSYSCVFIDAIQKPSDNTDQEKNPESSFPCHFFPFCRILQKSDDNPGETNGHRGRLKKMEKCRGQRLLTGGSKLQIKQYIKQSTANKGYSFPFGFHMTPFTTLLFPETAPLPGQYQPLQLFFTTLFHLGLDEQEEPDSQRLQSRSWLQTLYPAPLGADRQRFLYLLNNIRNRKDDYLAQLSHLTLASLSAELQFTESRTGIIQTVLENREEKDKTLEGEIWQARLLLAIAEIITEQQRDISQAMQELTAKEDQLFSTLHGELQDFEKEEFPLADNAAFEPTLPLNNATIENILKAWLVLISNKETLTPQQNCTIWTASQKEIADLLIEYHHRREKNQKVSEIILNLPNHLTDSDNKKSIIADFKRETEPLHTEIAELLQQDTAKQWQTKGAELAEQWNQMVHHFFPEKRYGRRMLIFYLCNRSISNYFPTAPSRFLTSKTKVFALFQ